MSHGRNTTTIGVRLPDELAERIRAKAAAQGIPVQTLIKRGIDEMMRPHHKGKSGAAKGAAKDAVLSETVSPLADCGPDDVTGKEIEFDIVVGPGTSLPLEPESPLADGEPDEETRGAEHWLCLRSIMKEVNHESR